MLSERSASVALSLSARQPITPSLCAEAATDPDARFSAFYQSTFSRVYALLRSQVRSSEVAEDLISKVFSKAYEHWHHAPPGDKATFWLFRIARNTLIDHWRVEGRRESLRVRLDDVEELSDPATPESVYASRERTRALLKAMHTLDDDDRMLVSLKFAGQRSNRDIASILGISDAAVSMRLLRALRRLRQRLQEEGRP